MKVSNVTLRGKVYYYYRRVPKHLVAKYGVQFLRLSLQTSDPHIAANKGILLNKKYDAEFSVLGESDTTSPVDVILAGKSLAMDYTLETYIDDVIAPAEEKFAANNSQYDLYERRPDPSDFLKPHQIQALRFLQQPDRFTLSDALLVYFQNHTKGNDSAFIAKTKRDWDTLIAMFGDIDFASLSRIQHGRAVIDHLLGRGLKTQTVRRMLNTIRAVAQSAIKEREMAKANPFKELNIQGEGRDKKPKSVAPQAAISEVIHEMYGAEVKPIPLIIIMQAELGTRIGEVSGLSVDDLHLDVDIPYVHFREHPWRGLKTDESERRVPLVGYALKAATIALTLPRQGNGLFECYAKIRGNDNASAAANKRLKKWGLTTHSFRHGMKDRLRSAGCPKDIRDAIQGHASGDVAETYGEGHTLHTMREWLLKVAVEINVAQPV